MKKFTKFLSSLFILFAGIAVLSCSNGPEPILPPEPYDGPTYEVKFEVVGTEYWLEDAEWDIDLGIINESKVIDPAIEYIKSHKPSFETKTLKENEEYVLKDYTEWMFDDTLKLEVQYFSDKGLTSSIEPGSVIKNENKTIYIKFVYHFYSKLYSKDYNWEYKNNN